jgi:hypothetical protein
MGNEVIYLLTCFDEAEHTIVLEDQLGWFNTLDDIRASIKVNAQKIREITGNTYLVACDLPQGLNNIPLRQDTETAKLFKWNENTYHEIADQKEVKKFFDELFK